MGQYMATLWRLCGMQTEERLPGFTFSGTLMLLLIKPAPQIKDGCPLPALQ